MGTLPLFFHFLFLFGCTRTYLHHEASFSCGMPTLGVGVGSSSPTRDLSGPPASGAWSLSLWTAGEGPAPAAHPRC